MWFVRAVKWILKLCLRIVLFPFFLVLTTLILFLNILLHIGSLAIALLALVMLYGIASQLFQHQWNQAALAFGITAIGVGLFYCAGLVIAMLETLNERLAGFVIG